jgi:hypothetical protein
MKIGILTMHEVKNYGSFLQAFSLKKNIEKLGCEVEFINIIPGEQLDEYKQSKCVRIHKLLIRLCGWNFIKRFKTIYQFQKRFSKEFLPILGVKSGYNNSFHDLVVIGSDEVFNVAQQTWFGFSPQLFGYGLNAGKIITYAASFGATTINIIDKLGLRSEIGKDLKNINQISVRDNNSFNVVKSLINIEPKINIDPVFIYDYSKYIPQKKHKNNYIIIYSYPGRISDKNEIKAIKHFAKFKNLKLLSIGHYFSWCDEVVVPTPFEVLSYFRDAAFVITDTFHGSVFSIKYNKPFATIVRNMNSNKLTFLLLQFGLENRIVSDMSELSVIEQMPINYAPVNMKIKSEKEKAITYLKDNIYLN